MRAVEAGRLHDVQPHRGACRHARHAGAEWESLGAKPLGARQRAPRAHVQAENGGDHYRVAGPYAHPPHDAGMGVGDRVPVVAADGEGSGATGGARGAVNVMHFLGRHAQVVAERRQATLCVAQILLGDDRHLLLEILKALKMVGMKACLVLAAVERGVLVGVARDFLQAFENSLLAVCGCMVSRLGNQLRDDASGIVVVVSGWNDQYSMLWLQQLCVGVRCVAA